MATITPTAMTYAEWALRHDTSGRLSTVVNLLSQTNGIIDDTLAVECQSGNAFEYTQVVKLPTPSRRTYNQGVPASLAGVAKQTTVCSEYGDWSVFDASLARLGGTLSELRAQEDLLHYQALGQQVASDMFYGNRATDPTQFTGLANIYNTVSTATSQIAKNVIDCGGTGSDNTSIWLVTWGPKQIHTTFPKGFPTGLQHQDFGLLPKSDSSNNEYPAYRTWIQWNLGLAIHDWRFAARACNIDVSDLAAGTGANLINTLIRLTQRLPIQPAGVGPVQSSDAQPALQLNRSAIYCNRTVATYLDIQANTKSNVLLQMEQWGTRSVTTFRGIPIRICDAITNAETRVV